MKYIGIETQKSRNNFRSLLLLFLFPCLVVGLVFLFCFLLVRFVGHNHPDVNIIDMTIEMFIQLAPFALGGVLIWFLIAYFANTSIIKTATSARTLERKKNKRIYNLVENLCISQGMKMPKINIINDNSLNAFASGINDKTYTVTLTKGIIEKLDDEELEGVIAHELSHIQNRDVRVLIVSIVFVGIFSMLTQFCLRLLRTMSYSSRSKNDKKGGILIILFITIVTAAIGYLFSTLMRFAISRNREYLADAGAAQMTRKPDALASALRKISGDPNVEAITREDVAQLFIEHPGKQAKGFLSSLSGLFATHPPIEKRIQVLEQF
ncbi:heat shock protein HtpX [Parabacteroides sp. PF5-5]|uniref:M48 family metallopeptidase n=1 Tax=unclassified Parabacteroides TaxID=2649774 RepID=UPI0024738D79|nr:MULTISPECIES: M48 family metallopeptidase [unclassified Parabacteroides]MDH6304783.1 heat shock protein HtpX [Parabacteroides sp. PH5-39]MDH6315602.1 heat shock protein HtpX [Parabacteroides sp. PF5-13]MDH6319263.1 heat shock protein HtpX [Parabacteroides sp. PH5-13]MDH6322994.1 heat shock protein HtpX [Parabacteroides sp. PH5-8]MDH6326795.1 heat shock protein HtpX [Parabacteroides sp. PH5-41]